MVTDSKYRWQSEDLLPKRITNPLDVIVSQL